MSVNHEFLIFTALIWMVSMARVESQIDGFKLVYMWPASYCHTLRNGETCAPGLPENFTIHGLWGFNASGVINCPPKLNYNRRKPKLLNQVLVDELNQIWINHRNEHSTSNNKKFWNYEWNKHSSCLNLGARIEYFQNVSKFHNLLVSQYLHPTYWSLLHLLYSNGISQKGYNQPQNILKKIYSHTHLAAELKCSNPVKNPLRPGELWEISFCISVHGSFLNCSKPDPNTFYQSKECPKGTKTIFLPPIPPKPMSNPPPLPIKRKRKSKPPYFKPILKTPPPTHKTMFNSPPPPPIPKPKSQSLPTIIPSLNPPPSPPLPNPMLNPPPPPPKLMAKSPPPPLDPKSKSTYKSKSHRSPKSKSHFKPESHHPPKSKSSFKQKSHPSPKSKKSPQTSFNPKSKSPFKLKSLTPLSINSLTLSPSWPTWARIGMLVILFYIGRMTLYLLYSLEAYILKKVGTILSMYKRPVNKRPPVNKTSKIKRTLDMFGIKPKENLHVE